MHMLCADQLQAVRGLIASLEMPEAGDMAAASSTPEERVASLAGMQAAMNETMQVIISLLGSLQQVGYMQMQTQLYIYDCPRFTTQGGTKMQHLVVSTRPHMVLQTTNTVSLLFCKCCCCAA